MKPLYTLLLVLLMPVVSIGQKVVVIDTLDLDTRVRGSFHFKFINRICGDHFGVDCYKYDISHDSMYRSTGEYPNVIAFLSQAPYLDHISISIIFDDKQSNLLLLNLDKVKEDTIRISKWGVYKNRLGGYDKGFKAYTRMINDSFLTSRPYKVDEFIRYDQIKKDTLKELGFTLNGKDYSLPLRIIPSSYRTSFDGCTPIKVYNKFSKYAAKHKEPYKRKFSYERFGGESERVDYIYQAVLDLSTAP